MLLNLQELAVIDDGGDDLLHVVRGVGGIRDDGVQGQVILGEVVLDRPLHNGRLHTWRFCAVVGWQVAQEVADEVKGIGIVSGGVVGGARHGHVGLGTAEFLLGNFFAGHRLDHGRSGDEHLGGFIHHDDEVCQSRGVHVATGAGTHNEGNLRDNATGLRVAEEDLGVQA